MVQRRDCDAQAATFRTYLRDLALKMGVNRWYSKSIEQESRGYHG